MIERYDEIAGYCRKLGHHLAFGYCRRVNQGLPCPLVRDCWFERLPILEFLAGHYTPAELDRLAAPAPGKLASILSVLERARSAS